jgi:hypothetical protein
MRHENSGNAIDTYRSQLWSRLHEMGNRSFRLELRSPRLRGWLEDGLSQLLEKMRSSVRWPELQRVQRFGGDAWQTIAARWPVLADLVRERKLVRARYRPAQPATPASGPLESDAIEALMAQLSAATSWQARASAVMSLAHVDGEDVVPALLRALRDPSVEVAVAAVDALGGRADGPAVDALLGVLQNTDGYFNPVTRVAAITGLARRSDLTSVEPLLAAVRDIDAEVSIAAIAVIAERFPDIAAAQLSPLLRDHSGYYLPLVRLAAANALERSGSLHAGIAAELLQQETDPALRRVLERAQYVAARHDEHDAPSGAAAVHGA